MTKHFIAIAACSILVSLGSQARATVTEGSLIHYWAFDSDLTDSAGSNDGTAVGSGTTVSGADTRVGGGALRIAHDTAGGDYVDITGAIIPSNPATFSISTWYKYEDLGSQATDSRNFVWETEPTWSTGFGLRDGGGNRDAEWFFDASSDAIDTSGPIVNDGGWHHVAMTWDQPGGLVQYFHDGALRDSVVIATTNTLSGNPVDGLHIGNHRSGDGARNWDGYIDDFAIFDVVLGAEDVAALWNDGDGGVAATSLLPSSQHPAPEPSSVVLLSLGCLLLGWRRAGRRRD